MTRTIFNVLGVRARRNGWIDCNEAGTAWEMTSDSGKVFVTGHVVALMFVVVMIENIFGSAAINSGLVLIAKAESD